MVYDTWSPYDPSEADTPEDVSRLRQRLQRSQRAVRAMLPLLRQEIENPDRAVPQGVVDKLHEMARSDPDDYVRRTIQRFLHEPWSQPQ